MSCSSHGAGSSIPQPLQSKVAEAVAAHLGITKAELLDPTAPDMAVRQALGETQVIAATKSALGDAGRCLRVAQCMATRMPLSAQIS